MANKTFDFTLVLTGLGELTRRAEDALFEAGCDDALVGIRSGVVYLDFDREASSLSKAIASAIKDVRKAKIGAKVARVEPDNLVNQSEIARRISQSRESVRKYIAAERGPGNFPAPAANLKGSSSLWRWNEVARWFVDAKLIEPCIADQADCVASVNNLLQLQERPRNLKLLLASGAFDVLPGRRGNRRRKVG